MTNEKLSILISSHDYKPQKGGLAEFMHNTALQLQRAGHKVTLAAPDYPESRAFDSKTPGIDIIRVGDKKTQAFVPRVKHLLRHPRHFLLGSIRSFFEKRRVENVITSAVKRKNIDIIICFHWVFYGKIAKSLKKKLNRPYYIVYHGAEIPRPFSLSYWRNKKILKSADGVFAVSNFTKKRVLNTFPFVKGICVTKCGTDTKKFFPEKKNASLLKKHSLQNRKVLFTLTRLVKRKGVDTVLKALRTLYDKDPDSDLIYLLAGTGPEEESLKSLANELGLTEKVIFLGHIDEAEKRDYYNLADIFILPSRHERYNDYEGFGIVFLEAAACGLPVIGSDSGGIPEAVASEKTGLLVEAKDPEEIALAIEKLLKERTLAETLGKNGRTRVKEHFTWEIITQRFIDKIKTKSGEQKKKA